MYHQGSLFNDLEYVQKPLNGGKKKEKLKRTERRQDSDATIATQLSIFHLLNQPSSTPELAVEVKKPTFSDRLTFFCLATPDAKLFKTSGAASISKEKVLSPYWNTFSAIRLT
jgi:hypothetical protein